MAERFGRYWLQEHIGVGGMAEVFRATIGPDPEVYAFELAVKRMHAPLAADPMHRGLFSTEAWVAASLVHPNVVRTFETGELEGRPYLTMELIVGVDLAHLLARHRDTGHPQHSC